MKECFLFVFVLYFSLEYGKIYIFYILVVDNDDDKIKCEFFLYIEVGSFSFLVDNFIFVNIIEMNDKEVCNILFI